MDSSPLGLVYNPLYSPISPAPPTDSDEDMPDGGAETDGGNEAAGHHEALQPGAQVLQHEVENEDRRVLLHHAQVLPLLNTILPLKCAASSTSFAPPRVCLINAILNN